MEINSSSNAISPSEIFGRSPSLDKLNKIAQSINDLSKNTNRTSHFAADVDKNGKIPSISRILPALMKQLAELNSDSNQYASDLNGTGDALPKDPKELSPLSFLTKNERNELSDLLNKLLKNSSKSTSKPQSEQTNSDPVASSKDQWALFQALKQVDSIIEKGEDRLHIAIDEQLSPEQQVLGNFLNEQQQDEVIALLGQKSLLQQKSADTPLNDSEKTKITQIDAQLHTLFNQAENTLRDANINVTALKTALSSDSESISDGQMKAILGQNNNNGKSNEIQQDLFAILTEEKNGSQSPSIGENYALNNLSDRQQVVLSLMNPKDFDKAMNIYDQLGKLTTQISLTSNDAKKVMDLTKQTTEMLQKSENQLAAKGVKIAQITNLLTSDKAPTQKKIETALGVQDGVDVNNAQHEGLELIVDNFLDGGKQAVTAQNPASQAAASTAVKADEPVAETKKVEYPRPLTPLQAIQKRIEAAQVEFHNKNVHEKATKITQQQGIPSKSANSAQPAIAPIEVQRSSAELSAAGFAGVTTARSQ